MIEWDVAQSVECPPSMHKVLATILSPAQHKTKLGGMRLLSQHLEDKERRVKSSKSPLASQWSVKSAWGHIRPCLKKQKQQTEAGDMGQLVRVPLHSHKAWNLDPDTHITSQALYARLYSRL